MGEWKEYRLGDIVTISSGFAYKGEHIGHGDNLLLGMGCVSFKEKFLMSGARPYAGDCADRYYVNAGNLVLATRQQSDNLPILGMPAIIPQELSGRKMIVGANLYRVINHSEFSNKYIFWLLKTPAYVNHIASCKTGTTVSMITKANVEDFVFKAPDKEERDIIEGVLGALDEKIDLLNRENATLEALAETLFRHHFIETPDPTWKEGKLENVVEVLDYRRKPLSKMERDKMKNGNILYPYYGAAEIMDYIDDYLFDGEYILLGEDGTVRTDDGHPILQLATGKFWPNNHAHVLQAMEPFNNCFLWYYFKTTNIDEIVTGAVQPKINQANLMSLPVYDYPIEIVEEFQNTAEPIWNKIKSNQQQMQTLAVQRDTLLPRLMSGEVKVTKQ